MKSILSSTALSAVLALGGAGVAGAQTTGGQMTPSAGQTVPGQTATGQPRSGATLGGPTAQPNAVPGTGPQRGQMGPSAGGTPGQPATGQPRSGATLGGPTASPGPIPGTGPQRGQAGPSAGQTVPGQQATRMDQNEVRDLLRNQGYSDVQGISRDGNEFRARAMQGSRQVDLRIDAYTGTIRRQQAGR